MEVILIGKGPGFKDAPKRGEGAVTWGVNDVVSSRAVDAVFWMDRHLLPGSVMDKTITASVNHLKVPMYSVYEYEDQQLQCRSLYLLYSYLQYFLIGLHGKSKLHHP